jgi:hypothetical protein
MNCEIAQQNIVLAQYGELPDDLQSSLEQHLGLCEDCRREWHLLAELNEELALRPLPEPSPNLLAASRMRLDEALDAIPPRSLTQRLSANAFRWLGLMQSAPALATLLLGVGFLGGNLLLRYQVARAPRATAPVIISNPAGGGISSVSGIVQTPNSEVVQVTYNRVIPEMVQGSLDDPQIRNLLVLGTKLAANNEVHTDAVAYLAQECMAGHSCDSDQSGYAGIRSTLLASLRTDRNPADRLKALDGLQRYVAQDVQVRNAVLDSVMYDQNSAVRAQAISLLAPVQADSSVRRVLRTVSTVDSNPAVRYASFQALQGTADIQ